MVRSNIPLKSVFFNFMHICVRIFIYPCIHLSRGKHRKRSGNATVRIQKRSNGPLMRPAVMCELILSLFFHFILLFLLYDFSYFSLSVCYLLAGHDSSFRAKVIFVYGRYYCVRIYNLNMCVRWQKWICWLWQDH